MFALHCEHGQGVALNGGANFRDPSGVVHLSFKHTSTTLCGEYRFDPRDGKPFKKLPKAVPSCVRCIAYRER